MQHGYCTSTVRVLHTMHAEELLPLPICRCLLTKTPVYDLNAEPSWEPPSHIHCDKHHRERPVCIKMIRSHEFALHTANTNRAEILICLPNCIASCPYLRATAALSPPTELGSSLSYIMSPPFPPKFLQGLPLLRLILMNFFGSRYRIAQVRLQRAAKNVQPQYPHPP